MSRNGQRLIVLAYHDVGDADSFGRHMALVRRAMHPVGVDELLDAQAAVRPLPRRAVLVTFDDGDRSVYERALPVLREHGIPAVVFVIAGLIDSDRPTWFYEARELVRRGLTIRGLGSGSADDMVRHLKRLPDDERRRRIDELRSGAPGPIRQSQLTTEELREMAHSGVEIGNHTYTHPCLDRCTDAVVDVEMSRAHEALTSCLGRAPRVFAYPNGNHDPRAEAVLQRIGYGAAFLFDHRIGRLPAANPFRISRVRVNSTTSMLRFRSIVMGAHPFIHHALGRR